MRRIYVFGPRPTARIHTPPPPHYARFECHTAVQDTDPVDPQDRNAANGPDSKTIERYLEALCAHGRAQKLAIPITLTTSAEVTKKMMAYVKPGIQVNDALVEQVRRLSSCLDHLTFAWLLSSQGQVQL